MSQFTLKSHSVDFLPPHSTIFCHHNLVVTNLPSPQSKEAIVMSMTFPNESAGYRTARNHLLEQEIELRRLQEAVAVARRAIPLGGAIPEDYAFTGLGADGSPTTIHLSELFADGKDSLIVYNFMYGPGMDRPCPSCSAFIDSLDGAAKHVEQRINVVVIAEHPLPRILDAVTERGWHHLRFLSSADTSFKRDYHGVTDDGDQMPIINVFQRHKGSIHHFSSSELMSVPPEPGQDWRHNGTLDLLWNLFDLTSAGRGTNWDPQLEYPSS